MIKQCIICGKDFTPRDWRQKCCSHECSKENSRRTTRQRYWGKSTNITANVSEARCSICSKSFTPNFFNERFCSDACRFQSPLYKILLGQFNAYGVDTEQVFHFEQRVI